MRVTSNVVAACCTIPMAAACGVSGPGRATAPGLVTPIGTVAAASTDDTVVIGCEAPRDDTKPKFRGVYRDVEPPAG